MAAAAAGKRWKKGSAVGFHLAGEGRDEAWGRAVTAGC